MNDDERAQRLQESRRIVAKMTMMLPTRDHLQVCDEERVRWFTIAELLADAITAMCVSGAINSEPQLRDQAMTMVRDVRRAQLEERRAAAAALLPAYHEEVS